MVTSPYKWTKSWAECKTIISQSIHCSTTSSFLEFIIDDCGNNGRSDHRAIVLQSEQRFSYHRAIALQSEQRFSYHRAIALQSEQRFSYHRAIALQSEQRFSYHRAIALQSEQRFSYNVTLLGFCFCFFFHFFFTDHGFVVLVHVQHCLKYWHMMLWSYRYTLFLNLGNVGLNISDDK
jgi:hypothetical protein